MTKAKRNVISQQNCKLSTAIEIEIFETFEKVKPSINWTQPEIATDLRDGQYENVVGPVHFNSECVPNETDESEWQYEKHDEQRIRIRREIVIDLIEEQYENASHSMYFNLEFVSSEINKNKL
jgi:hypothetical protein